MAYRIEKVESLIKQEMSHILLFKFYEPLFGFITITRVKVAPDLRLAYIYVSVLEKEKRERTMERITENIPAIRSELASRINLRFVPELKFFLDDTLDYVEKIDNLLKQIHKNDQPPES
jgi:ribosome-binding factor A